MLVRWELCLKRGCLMVLVRPGASWGLSVSSMREQVSRGLPLLAGGANNPTRTMLLPGPNPWPEVSLATAPVCFWPTCFLDDNLLCLLQAHPAGSSPRAFIHTVTGLLPVGTGMPFPCRGPCFPLPGPSQGPQLPGRVCLSQEACLSAWRGTET